MNFPSSLPIFATALIPFTALADGPARLTPEERTAIEVAAASVGQGFKADAAGVKDRIEADRLRSNGANQTVREFIAQATLSTIAIEDAPAPAGKDPAAATDPAVAASKPLEVKPGPQDTVISADDGMFLDAEKGLLVYLKNVRLTGPDFDLSGVNELKVFLGKKEEKKKDPAKEGEAVKEEKKPEKKSEAPGMIGATGGFGDPEKIIATGAVKITQKAVGGKPPVVASAAVLTYDAKSGEIILNGGYPWVVQGTTFMRAKQPNLYLRIKKDGSFVTEGEWDMGGQLNAKPAAPKPAPNPANP